MPQDDFNDIIKVDDIDFDKAGGLIPVIVQDFITKDILMLAYANKEAVEYTLKTGYAHFWSRSRRKLWMKGETSGNTLKIVKILIDCDEDTLIYQVKPSGPTCHTGNKSCFYRELNEGRKLNFEYTASIKRRIDDYFRSSYIYRREWVKDSSYKIYKYIINPITDNIPPPDPEVLSWIADQIHENTSNDIDKVLVPEALGIPIASLVAQLKNKPLAIVRKRFFGERGLLDIVEYSSGYEKGEYYIYGVEKGESVLIIDDAISTGGTLTAIINALRKNQVKIRDIFCVLEKIDYNGRENVYRETGLKVKTLIRVKITEDDTVQVLW